MIFIEARSNLMAIFTSNSSSPTDYIRDLMIRTMIASKDSKVPVLYFSNPGFGKTTNVRLFCNTYGYELEELRGASSSPEEILGYKVNDGVHDYLKTMLPDWFVRIKEGSENKKKYVLFIDEITTSAEFTQGALLKLIFDREIDGQKLPEDTVIVSAGNYKNNLSGQFNMLPPTLNRFMLINLQPKNPVDFVKEFTKYDPDRSASIESYPGKVVTDAIREKAHDLISNMLVNIISTRTGKDASEGRIDFNNTDFQGIYDDADTVIYNFMSGRTMSYLVDVAIACYQNSILVGDEMVLGLIGLGTNNFVKGELGKYQQDIVKKFNSVLKILATSGDNKSKKFEMDIKKPISSLCNEYIQARNEGNPDDIDLITSAVKLSEHIKKTYDLNKVISLGNASKDELRVYISDMDAITKFNEIVKELSPDATRACEMVLKINKNYYNQYLYKI